jgi:hypothetical protein
MKGHTDAFVAYRGLSQAHLDFVVIICHAIPALEADLALSKPNLTYPPDHFKSARNPKAWVAANTKNYQDELARSTLITVFSYFESYVRDVLFEVVTFHGGREELWKYSKSRSATFLSSQGATTIQNKRKLQDTFEKRKIAKYQKYARLLDSQGFRFPSDLFATLGLRLFLEKVEQKNGKARGNGLRAWEIPYLLEDGLLFPLTKQDLKLFEDARELRNKIGHGKPPKLTLKTSLRYSSELHTLAAKIDRHILEHFLIIQKT